MIWTGARIDRSELTLSGQFDGFVPRCTGDSSSLAVSPDVKLVVTDSLAHVDHRISPRLATRPVVLQLRVAVMSKFTTCLSHIDMYTCLCDFPHAPLFMVFSLGRFSASRAPSIFLFLTDHLKNSH